MKKLFSVLRMCETNILQTKWLELERCSYPDRLSPYHRLDGYSVIVAPGKEDVFREWVDSHVSTAKAENGAVDYADAIIPVLSMLTNQEFYTISEAMLAYYSDFDAMMHYCLYSPEAERLDVFSEAVIPIAEEEEAEVSEAASALKPELAPEVELVSVTAPKEEEKMESIVAEARQEDVLQPVQKIEDVAVPSPITEQEPERVTVSAELFTDEQVSRIVAYLLTLNGEEVATTFLSSLQDAYYGKDRRGITTLLLRMFDHLSARKQEG